MEIGLGEIFIEAVTLSTGEASQEDVSAAPAAHVPWKGFSEVPRVAFQDGKALISGKPSWVNTKLNMFWVFLLHGYALIYYAPSTKLLYCFHFISTRLSAHWGLEVLIIFV